MAGEDQLKVSNGTITIIPANGKLTNGNGLHKESSRNNNGAAVNGNGKELDATENGKLVIAGDDKCELEDDDETSFGWGPFRPKCLQRFATKQMFLVVFCLTWVRFLFLFFFCVSEFMDKMTVCFVNRYCRVCTSRTSYR